MANARPLVSQTSSHDASSAFTIVELLIVIVVVAILATIVIVAYNGIAQRAQASTAQSSAQQLATKLQAYNVDNGAYPNQLSDAGINPTGGTTFQYTVNNSASPQTYCATVTNGSVSYYVDNSQHTTPTAGACAGQAPNGDIINLATNPIATSGWSPGFGTSGNGNTSIVSDNRFPSSVAYQLTWTTAPTSNSALYVSENGPIPCVVGEQYFMSARYTTSWAGMQPIFYLGGSPQLGIPATVTSRGDGSYEARASWTATSACTSNFFPLLAGAGSSPLPGVGATFEVGGFMVVANQPSGTNYADGNSPGWSWTGTANNSTSEGPAL